jgi:two-component system sensor histidine kinase KdpD
MSTRAPWLRRARAWALSFGLLAALTALSVAYRPLLNQRQAPVALTLLMVVLLGSVTAGRTLGLALAFGGFLVINYFFQVPYGDVGVHDPADWLVLITFVVTADVASRLLARAQRLAEAAQRRAEEVERLADLGAETLAAPLSAEALRAIAAVITDTLRLDRCEIWDVDADGVTRLVAGAPMPTDGTPPPDAKRLARVRDDDAAPRGETSAAERSRRYAEILAGAPADALVPLSAHGRMVGALRIARSGGLRLDDSQRTFLQALAHYAALGVERARLAADLRQSEILREADRLKDFFLAAVSHDLRTPLTTIKALAHERVRAGDRGAAVIEEQADRLTRMVDDLLDLSRARAGVLPTAAELNTAEDVVGAARRQVVGVLGDRPVEAHFREEGGPLVGHFDFVATLRVLGNLIENAHKYSPAGQPIRLEVAREGDTLRFTVGDRGPGVADEERERIFGLFHRAPGTRPDTDGAGLGLAVARALAESQGGSVSYEARDGGGSTFTLRLPASDDALALQLIAGHDAGHAAGDHVAD